MKISAPQQSYPFIFILTILVTTLLNNSCSRKGGMMLIGLNEKGQMVKRYLPPQHVTEVGTMIDGIKDETLTMLARRESEKNNPWELKVVYLGISIFGQAGNPVLGVNASSFLEFMFERN